VGEPLRVLLVEDSEDDSTLLGLELRRGGYSPEVRRVETEEAMLSALVEGKWDIAIVDYSLPRFSALAALTLIRDSRLDLPVILVSGTVGEEAGAEAMQRGAADFVPKTNLSRLVPAVKRQLKYAADHRGWLQAERDLDLITRQFATTAAHELRTPLTTIKLQAHLLRNAKNGTLTPAQERSLEILSRSVDRLGDVVEKLVTVTLIQSGRFTILPRTLDLSRLVSEVASSVEAPASRAGLALRANVEASLVCAGDARALRQALYNLLSNAIQFTPPGGEVVVRARRLTTEAVEVVVQDTGVGLRATDVDRLFQPFAQVEDPTRAAPSGSGLGLYITRALVEAHRGQVRLESPGPGQGTTAVIHIPIAGAPLPTQESPGLAPSGQTGDFT